MTAIDPPHPKPVDPRKSPSYPQRVHIQERSHWKGVLQHWEDRIVHARKELQAMDVGPRRAFFERKYVQMLGARDQIATAAERLPMEVGDLYEEDRHLLENGVAALERLFRDWK